MIFCRSDITSRQLHNLENSTADLEHVCIELFCNGKRILLSSMYRPPNCNKENFKLNLSVTLEKLRNNLPHINLITGDFNYGGVFDFFNTLSTTPFDYETANIFEQNFLTQLIDVPTRYQTTINGHSVSLLDHIWIDRVDLVTKASVCSQISDHCLLALELDLICRKPKNKIIEKYNFSGLTSQNYLDLKTHLQSFKFSDAWSVDQHCAELTNHLTEGLSKFVPRVKYKQKDLDIPWSNAQIRQILQKKNRAYKVYRQAANSFNLLRPSDNNYYAMRIRVSRKNESFKQASKNYKNASRAEKNRYFSNLKNVWSNPQIPTRKKFQILLKLTKTQKNASIPPLLDSGKIIDDPIEKANLFNQFFTDKSQVNRPNDNPPHLDKIVTDGNFDNITTSHFELGPIIKSLKSSNYSPCGVPGTFIKLLYTHAGSIITKLISNLLNAVFSSGVYPKIWKLSHISPIHKKGSKAEMSNYRPISILPTLSKITESVIHSRLLRHLLSNNLISKQQAAYLPADSTAQQLLSMIHLIKTTMASNNIAQAVFLDVSSAFDAVWHKGLLAKLEQINISGPAYQLFSSYLTDRKAVTVIDGHKSAELPLRAGVPQGSRLGPLLFITFLNDIVTDLESTPYLYADDTTLVARANSTYETTNILNRDLAKIYNWALTWKVTFNASKSKDIIFSKSLLPSHPTILGLQFIERVHLHKHLGLYINSSLTWDKQIESIVKKVNFKLSIMWQVKELSRQCLDVLFKLHVRSSIDYAITVFGPSLNDSQIKTLDNLTYRAARLVTGAQKYTSSEKLLNELGWENTTKRIEYLCLTQFYKIIHRQTTPLVHECLPPRLNSNYPTNRTFQHYPFMSSFFVNSFFPFTIKKWDQLHTDLRNEPDFTLFKIKLKEKLKPMKFRHFHVGFKYPNTLHTQLRLGRSFLNCHLFPIGQSITKYCQCGNLESVQHFLLDCNQYDQARGQLFQKLEGLLENKPNTYTKQSLCQILLCGEKPHLPEKYVHNKHIFYAVQTFLCKTKRLFYNEQNKPNRQNNVAPPE